MSQVEPLLRRPFFELFDARIKFRETVNAHNRPLPLTDGTRRTPDKAGLRFDIIAHAALRTNDHTGADFDVANNPGLTGKNHIIADFRAAGDADLGTNDAMFSNHDVVGDHDEIVYLGSLANDGAPKARAIHRGVCANFNIILHDHTANLRNFMMAPIPRVITKTIPPDHRAAVKNDAISQFAMFPDNNPRVQKAVFANRNSASDKSPGTDNGTRG